MENTPMKSDSERINASRIPPLRGLSLHSTTEPLEIIKKDRRITFGNVALIKTCNAASSDRIT